MMAVDFVSAFAVGSAAHENVYDLALDGAGNTCIVGRFNGTVDFEPGLGSYELTSIPSGTGNTFAAKYDPSGNLLWAQQMGGGSPNFGPEIAASNDGSVYIVGSFTGSNDFGATVLTSVGSDDAYLVKLDSNGSFVWARRFGGMGADWGNDVSVDGLGNVYVMAETRSSASASPDTFFAKLDASGNTLWTFTVGASSSTTTKGNNTSTSGWARGFKLTVDGVGDVYATGRMSGSVDFDPGPGSTKLTGDGFVMKLSTSGNLVWARTFTGGLTVEPHDIAVDSNGNVYSTGVFLLAVDFDPGTQKSQKFILDGGTDQNGTWNTATYVSALNSSGNFLWAKSTQMVGSLPYSARADALAIDGAGGIYIAGEFTGTGDFNPSSGAYNLTSAGDVDAFVWKLDTSGNFVWSGQMGAAGADRAHGIGVDAGGSIFVAGVFTGTADLDPGPSTYNLTGAGGNDFFIAKLVQPVALTVTASESRSDTVLLVTTPTRRLSSKAADSALANLADGASAGWNDPLDEELLIVLASA